MGLPLLYSQPDSDESWKAWTFNHAAIHYTIVGAIQVSKNANPSQYCLDPVDQNDLDTFLYQHQVMHNQTNAILGTQGYDLLELDWDDPEQFEQWLRLNGDEHQKWAQILKV